MSDKRLDVSGLKCPLPIVKANKALKTLCAGETLHVICTDEEAVADFKAYSNSTKHQLLKSWQQQQQFHFLIEKGNSS